MENTHLFKGFPPAGLNKIAWKMAGKPQKDGDVFSEFGAKLTSTKKGEWLENGDGMWMESERMVSSKLRAGMYEVS